MTISHLLVGAFINGKRFDPIVSLYCQFSREVCPVCITRLFGSHETMAKAAVLLIASMLITYSVAQFSSKSGNCPLRNSVNQCTPSCTSDFQCSSSQKCCPNKCGSKSCVSPSSVSTGSDGGYKGSDDGGVYCDGRKCGRYEKCEFDRSTKRNKCVRT